VKGLDNDNRTSSRGVVGGGGGGKQHLSMTSYYHIITIFISIMVFTYGVFGYVV
jgi:hypothetical protein